MSYTSREVYEFISKQTNDPIIERKTCTVSSQKFAIFQSDVEFYNKISPTFNGKRFQIPTPTLCPEERQRRRLLFRNERKLYKRKCDATGDNIISIYSPDKPYKVYDTNFWWSDSRDPMIYKLDFDSSQSFTEQFIKLQLLVPRLPLFATNNENSSYSNGATQLKSCYLLFVSDYCEDSLYCQNINYSKNTVDCSAGSKYLHCYECIGCDNCTNSYYSQNCQDCQSLFYCHACQNCQNCIWCVGLHHKKFCIYNTQYTQKEYEQLQKVIHSETTLQELQKLTKNHINPTTHNDLMSHIIFGDDIQTSTNAMFCFESANIENCKYTTIADKVSSCQDSYVIVDNSYHIYESISVINQQSCISNTCCRRSQYIYYSEFCIDCSNCFWCIWLRNKQYCIFNKQYSKEEYEVQVAKVITHMQSTGEWGEFFNPSLSPFGYNETVANEYFPLQENEAIARWHKRQENNYDPIIPAWAKVIDRKTTIDEPQDDETILKSIFVCEVSWRPYRIIKQELEFYRKHNLPLPRKHPDIRHEERMKVRPGRTLYLRNCDKCEKEMLSVYDAKYEWKVYCESCYQQEVYS